MRNENIQLNRKIVDILTKKIIPQNVKLDLMVTKEIITNAYKAAAELGNRSVKLIFPAYESRFLQNIIDSKEKTGPAVPFDDKSSPLKVLQKLLAPRSVDSEDLLYQTSQEILRIIRQLVVKGNNEYIQAISNNPLILAHELPAISYDTSFKAFLKQLTENLSVYFSTYQSEPKRYLGIGSKLGLVYGLMVNPIIHYKDKLYVYIARKGDLSIGFTLVEFPIGQNTEVPILYNVLPISKDAIILSLIYSLFQCDNIEVVYRNARASLQIRNSYKKVPEDNTVLVLPIMDTLSDKEVRELNFGYVIQSILPLQLLERTSYNNWLIVDQYTALPLEEDKNELLQDANIFRFYFIPSEIVLYGLDKYKHTLIVDRKNLDIRCSKKITPMITKEHMKVILAEDSKSYSSPRAKIINTQKHSSVIDLSKKYVNPILQIYKAIVFSRDWKSLRDILRYFIEQNTVVESLSYFAARINKLYAVHIPKYDYEVISFNLVKDVFKTSEQIREVIRWLDVRAHNYMVYQREQATFRKYFQNISTYNLSNMDIQELYAHYHGIDYNQYSVYVNTFEPPFSVQALYGYVLSKTYRDKLIESNYDIELIKTLVFEHVLVFPSYITPLLFVAYKLTEQDEKRVEKFVRLFYQV